MTAAKMAAATSIAGELNLRNSLKQHEVDKMLGRKSSRFSFRKKRPEEESVEDIVMIKVRPPPTPFWQLLLVV